MKLILCLKCHDVYKLSSIDHRTCQCKATWGYYLRDGLKAEVSDNEHTQVLGFLNGTLLEAIAAYKLSDRGTDGLGHRFTAFVMPDDNSNIQRKSEARDS